MSKTYRNIPSTFLVFLFAILLSSCHAQSDFESAIERAAKELTDKLQIQLLGKVAVVNFTSHLGEENELGIIAAEEFTYALIDQAFGFEVMDRGHLQAIFEEHKLAMGGLVNEASLIEWGKLESVEALVIGSITRLDNKYKLTLKAIDTETAGIVAASKCVFSVSPAWDAYYGYKAPITPPKILPVARDCMTADGSYLGFHNTSHRQLECTISSDSGGHGHRDLSFLVQPGVKKVSDMVTSGIIYYTIKDALTGAVLSKGSMWTNQCETAWVGAK
ncbi:MAG: hypothetical protein ACI84C_000217 [Flavobacteriales bacterium]|jgi:hypothetical protein